MQKWIIFDVDDVVVSYRESLYQSFKALGKDIHWSQWNTYKHVKIYGLKDYDEFLEHMKTYRIIENSPIEEGIFDLLHKLKEDGYSIGFLTARSWHPKAYEVTQEFIEKYKLPIDKVVIANFKGKKTDYISEFSGEIVGFLDDSIGHVEDFVTANIPNSYLMDRPWNQENVSLPRIKSYNDFYNSFSKKSVKKIK
jgi:FMN phosphatase YigB (HAD superfamily)